MFLPLAPCEGQTKWQENMNRLVILHAMDKDWSDADVSAKPTLKRKRTVEEPSEINQVRAKKERKFSKLQLTTIVTNSKKEPPTTKISFITPVQMKKYKKHGRVFQKKTRYQIHEKRAKWHIFLKCAASAAEPRALEQKFEMVL